MLICAIQTIVHIQNFKTYFKIYFIVNTKLFNTKTQEVKSHFRQIFKY